MWKFFESHFDKLLLSFLFMVVFHWGVVTGAPVEVKHEIFSFASGFQGALLGLITGIAVGQRMASAVKPSEPKE